MVKAAHANFLHRRIHGFTIADVQRKIFWIVFTLLGLLADFLLPLWWALAATVPALFIAWWVAYRSDWF